MNKKITSAVLGSALAVAGLVGMPAAAGAAQAAPAAVSPSEAPDGNFYLYADADYRSLCLASKSSVADAGACGLSAGSLWNNGHPGTNADIWVHNGTGYSGWRRGVYNGVALANLHEWSFDGGGPELWHNIRSVSWTKLG